MSVGPIEFVVLAFPGSRFTGDIRPRIEDAIRAGIVRIVDAVLIRDAVVASAESCRPTSTDEEFTAMKAKLLVL